MMDSVRTSNSTSKSFHSWSATLAYSQSYIQKLSQFLNTVLNLHRNDGFSAFIQTYIQMFPFLVCDKRHNSPRSTTFKLAVQSPHIISLCRQHISLLCR